MWLSLVWCWNLKIATGLSFFQAPRFTAVLPANPLISNLSMAYGDEVPMELREGKDLILVGKASNPPFIAEFNEGLPAPFDFDTDTASEKQMQIIYRLPPDADIGYLETLLSPLDESRVMLIVSGNTDQGVNLAGNTLIFSDLRQQLAGQFAVSNGIQVETSRVVSPFGTPIRQTSIVGNVIEDVAVLEESRVVGIKVPDLSRPEEKILRPVWLSPFITASIVLIVAVLLFALISGLRGSRSST